ncbi:hypothetical protein TrVE_jg9695 [Triparma verrucosa]|uniref:Formin-like protein n=1 Tax=Triparma verrucosa TaxID=1606542 RepID=A0A9W7FCH7_9STRA|nr:hypothetical protein TrVE_jg9695 [Triparma verrucosa]
MLNSLYNKTVTKVLGKLTSPPTSRSGNYSTSTNNRMQRLERDWSDDDEEEDQDTDWINEEAKVIFDNLDMHFITRQIIAMSRITPPPSSSSNAHTPAPHTNTNDSPQVSKLMSSLSESDNIQPLIFNLSDTPLNSTTLPTLSHQSVDIGWVSPGSKSQTPSIPHVFEICYQLKSYLSSSPLNLSLITCSNGKTRTGIVVACYLKYSTLVDSSFDGFNLFCSRRCSNLSTRKSISNSIPPSLKQFFRNFDDCCELSGFPNPSTLTLKSIGISGVPVDDIPCIDIWSSSSQIYSSSAVDSESLQQWDEESGFYKINLDILGDFVIICRFGGEYKEDVNDPTKVLFRYANSTGFLCQGAYELGKEKVDMMKRYAGSFDEDDFKVVLLFDVPSTPSDQSPSLPTVCTEGEAYDLGWSSLSKHHALFPSSEACEIIVDKGYPLEVATIALQLGNNDVQRAIELLRDTLGTLCDRLGAHNNGRRGSSDGNIVIRRSNSEGHLNFIDVTNSDRVPQDNFSTEEDESTLLLDAIEKLNLNLSSPGPEDAVFVRSDEASSPLSAELVVVTSPPMPDGSEIERAISGRKGNRRVTIASNVPERVEVKTPEKKGGREEYEDDEENSKFVDARSLATPPTNKKDRRESRSKTNPETSKSPVATLFAPDEKSSSSTTSTTSNSTDQADPSEEVKDMLIQLKQAGISLDDLIKMKQGNLPWNEVERRSSNAAGTAAPVKKEPEAPPQPPANPAEAMKAMFAKRAAAEKQQDTQPAVSPPANPADAIKAMLAKKESAAPPQPPANPGDAMKAMFAKRAAEAQKPTQQPTQGQNKTQPQSSDTTTTTTPPPATTTGVPLNKDPAFTKYFKMLKMGIPLPAVKQQMMKDSVDPSIMDQDHKLPYVPKPPLKLDPAYSKYFKMLKMQIPLPAVKQAMIKDGLDPNILDCDHDKPLPNIIPGAKTKAVKKKKKKEPKTWDKDAPKLKDDERFTKYFKMRKMGLPVGAVQNAMVKDGLDPKIIEYDPEKSLSQHEAEKEDEADDSPVVEEKPKAPKRRRKKLDWKPIGKDKVDKDSIWGDVSGLNLDLDMEEFDTLFVAQPSPDQKQKKAAAAATNKDGTPKKKKASVQVINPKRGMNCGISLARIKVAFPVVAEAIDMLKENVVTPEQLMVLKECLPDKDEKYGLEQYLKKNGPGVEELCEAEKFMCAVIPVSNPSAKIDALVLKSNFATRRNEIIETAKAVETACDDVRISHRLKKLLAIILKVGNQLNVDGGNKAHAFTIESLLKLNQAKAFDRKTSILHYLVMVVKRNDEKNNETLLKFKEDIKSIVKAEKISFSQMVLDELRKLQKELTSLTKVAEDESDRIKNCGDEGLVTSLRMSVSELAGQRSRLKTSDGTTHFDKAILDNNDLALTPIGRFSIDAKVALEEMKAYAEKTQEKFNNVLKYFGENDSLTPIQFFSTLGAFVKAFDSAVEDVQKEEKRKAREKRLLKMKEEKETEAERKRKLKEGGGGEGSPRGSSSSRGSGAKLGDLPTTPRQKGKIQASRRASTMTSTPKDFGF